MAETASVNIPTDLIKPVIEAEVQAAIIRGLGHSDQLIRNMVTHILERKVDENGKDCHYSRENLLDVLAKKAIKDAVKLMVDEWVKSQMPFIQKQLETELSKKKNGLAALMTQGLADALKSGWRFQVNCQFKDEK